jgi:PAS domain-containing protein
MPTISDPTRLSKEELIAEWAVREEELRLQFESLKMAQTQSQLLLQRYERMFAYSPQAMLVIDSRARVQEANQAARRLLGDSLDSNISGLPELLDNASRLALSQALRTLSATDAPVAQELHCRFSHDPRDHAILLVALDAQRPPNSYAFMFGHPDVAETG